MMEAAVVTKTLTSEAETHTEEENILKRKA